MRENLKSFVKRSPILYPLAQAAISSADLCRRPWWIGIRAQKISTYLASHPIRKLQIGTGPNPLADWLNTDIRPSAHDVIFLDAAKRLPFDNSTFDYIFCEHFIEHLTYEDGSRLLREAFRVLKPGGKVRLATPDLERVVGIISSDRNEDQQAYMRFIIDRYAREADSYRPSFAINTVFHSWGHKFLYDRSTLESVMAAAGFTKVTRFAVRESGDEHLRNLELHGTAVQSEGTNEFITMVLEATHP